ncbi:uncharacterized protein [Centruroides vittatus]|uniref:uncharacterized protein n=1 Tax=Centruroides vittatus TaxID=120091 RepID=UPI00351095E8
MLLGCRQHIVGITGGRTYVAHLGFSKVCDPSKLYTQIGKIQSIASVATQKTKKRLSKKLQWLLKFSYAQKTVAVPTPYHNYTEESVPTIVHNMLQRGPKYIPPPSSSDFDQLVPAALAAIKSCQPTPMHQQMELEVFTKLATTKRSQGAPKNRGNHQVVTRFLATNGLRLLMSDKDRRFVLCRENDFTSRANDFLLHSCSVEMDRDPTPTVLRKARKITTLPGLALTLSGHLEPPSNVACPRLFFQPKTHKENWPLRPLVNKRSHPTYHLEKALAKFLRELLPESPFVTPSSIEAKTTIEANITRANINICTFYKMDVISLYPSVPTFEAVMLANTMLLKKGLTVQQVLDIREALIFVTENNYFRFNQKIYLQKQGVPMGSPLSAVLAELVMRDVEQKTFNAPLTICYPLLYLRYVDDILVAWGNSEEEFIRFMQRLSSVYPTIKFTWEKERNQTITFLDMQIQKSPEGPRFAVYHKSDMIPHITPADAFQPSRYINAAIAALIRRAILLPSSQDLINDELEIIRMAVLHAGFTGAKFTHVLRRVNDSIHPFTTLHNKKEMAIVPSTLPYLGAQSILISRIFRRYGFVLPLTPLPSLRRTICNDRDKISALEKSGVYAVPLKNPTTGEIEKYIGATTRMIACRIAEHQDDINKGRQTTELTKKVLQQGYTPLWSETALLKSSNNRKIIFIWEAILTITAEACNVPTLDLPEIWVTLYKRINTQTRRQAHT